MTSSLGNVNKPSGSQFSIIFWTFVDFKNQSRYASGFYDVKGTKWAIYLKSTNPLPIIFKASIRGNPVEILKNALVLRQIG